MKPSEYVMHTRSCDALKEYTDLSKELNELYCVYVKDTSKARAKLDKSIRALFKKHDLKVNPPTF